MSTESEILPNPHNASNSATTPNKPPISPKLSTNYDLIMQNKANLLDDQMNVNKVLSRDYENIPIWTLNENKAKQSQFPNAMTACGGLLQRASGGWKKALRKNFQKKLKKTVNGIDRYLVLLYTGHYGKSIF